MFSRKGLAKSLATALNSLSLNCCLEYSTCLNFVNLCLCHPVLFGRWCLDLLMDLAKCAVFLSFLKQKHLLSFFVFKSFFWLWLRSPTSNFHYKQNEYLFPLRLNVHVQYFDRIGRYPWWGFLEARPIGTFRILLKCQMIVIYSRLAQWAPAYTYVVRSVVGRRLLTFTP